MKFCIILLVVAVVAVTGVNSSPRIIADSDCPKLCTRMWHPVCAKLNGLQVNVSNKCMLDGLIQCTSSDNRVWEFLHEGSCKSDDTVSEEVHIMFNSDEGTDESEDADGDDQVDEQIDWTNDNELSEN